jgi:glycosyltransferase involved in cell wall biosynthesis
VERQAPVQRQTDDRTRRVLVLASKAKGLAPGQRFRFEQWAPRLKRDHGIELDLLPFESPGLTEILYKPGHRVAKAGWVSFDFLRRASAVLAARNYDAILVVREAALIGPAFYERLIAWTGKPMVFDFDDSIWSQAQQKNNGWFSNLHFFGKTSTLCRIAAACTPGNEFLADYARTRNPNTFVIPTSIELDDYRVVPEPSDERPFVVCWTGSTSTLAHFEFARDPLERLAAQIPLAVKVICNKPPERPIAGAEMRFVPWSADREAEEVGDCHAGIMPLPDDEVTRGKCGLKALQCMATGRPVVISPVGVNSEIIDHGRNGFLAGTANETVSRLLELAGSPELRRRMGAAARNTVEERYSAEVVAAKFADVLRFVMGDESSMRRSSP